MAAPADLQKELEALRSELRQVPIMEEDVAVAPGVGAEVERALHDLQAKLGEVADDAEDMVAAHPYASVAAAFLLGILVANFLSRKA